MVGLIVAPSIDVTRNPRPMSRSRSAGLALPGVSSRLPVAGEGGPEVPRLALPVGAIPSLRALARSSTQPERMPPSTQARGTVSSPSASKGRAPAERGRSGSSVKLRAGGRTG